MSRENEKKRRKRKRGVGDQTEQATIKEVTEPGRKKKKKKKMERRLLLGRKSFSASKNHRAKEKGKGGERTPKAGIHISPREGKCPGERKRGGGELLFVSKSVFIRREKRGKGEKEGENSSQKGKGEKGRGRP